MLGVFLKKLANEKHCCRGEKVDHISPLPPLSPLLSGLSFLCTSQDFSCFSPRSLKHWSIPQEYVLSLPCVLSPGDL